MQGPGEGQALGAAAPAGGRSCSPFATRHPPRVRRTGGAGTPAPHPSCRRPGVPRRPLRRRERRPPRAGSAIEWAHTYTLARLPGVAHRPVARHCPRSVVLCPLPHARTGVCAARARATALLSRAGGVPAAACRRGLWVALRALLSCDPPALGDAGATSTQHPAPRSRRPFAIHAGRCSHCTRAPCGLTPEPSATRGPRAPRANTNSARLQTAAPAPALRDPLGARRLCAASGRSSRSPPCSGRVR